MPLWHWFSTWGHEPQRGCEPFWCGRASIYSDSSYRWTQLGHGVSVGKMFVNQKRFADDLCVFGPNLLVFSAFWKFVVIILLNMKLFLIVVRQSV